MAHWWVANMGNYLTHATPSLPGGLAPCPPGTPGWLPPAAGGAQEDAAGCRATRLPLMDGRRYGAQLIALPHDIQVKGRKIS